MSNTTRCVTRALRLKAAGECYCRPAGGPMKIEITEEMRRELREIEGSEQMARLHPSDSTWTDSADVGARRLARLVAAAVEKEESK